MSHLTPLQRAGFLLITTLILSPPVLCQTPGKTAAKQNGAESSFRKAFVVDDRIAALRQDADIRSQVVHRLRVGRPVLITGVRSSGRARFYRVAVTRRTRGWIHEAAVAAPGRAGDDARVVKIIESEKDGLNRLSLCRLFLEHFNRSPLAPRVLLALGEEADRAATGLGQRARKRLESLSEENPAADLRDYYLSDAGLDRYSKLHIRFDFNPATSEYVYDGQAYRDIIKHYGRSAEAQSAQKHLEERKSF